MEAKKLGRRRPDLLDDLSEKMSDAFWVWNASEYDIVAVTAFEAGFEIDSEDCAGQQVTLVGLVGREELNGRKGTVRFYQGPPKRRFAVEVEEETGLLSLRPANLRVRLADRVQSWHDAQTLRIRDVVSKEQDYKQRNGMESRSDWSWSIHHQTRRCQEN